MNAMEKMGRNLWLLLGGSVVALVFMFFPWYSASYTCPSGLSAYCGDISSSVSGFHNWGILFFLAAIVLIALVVLRTFMSTVQLPAMPMADWMIELILCAIMLAGILLYWADAGSGDSGPGFSVGLGWAWYVSLVATVVAAVGAFLNKGDTPAMTSAAAPPPPPAMPPPAMPPPAQ